MMMNWRRSWRFCDIRYPEGCECKNSESEKDQSRCCEKYETW